MNTVSPNRRTTTTTIMPTIFPVFPALVFDPMPPKKNELIISDFHAIQKKPKALIATTTQNFAHSEAIWRLH